MATNELALYVNFEESAPKIEANAARLGLDVSEIHFLDLSPSTDLFTENRAYTVFGPDEVELEGVVDAITDIVDDVAPTRVFIDPLTHLRYLAPDEYQFRREVTAFTTYLAEKGATVLFATQPSRAVTDEDLEYLGDGTIEIGYSPKGRTLSVTKFRGSDFWSGGHTMRISSAGLSVYPQLVPEVFTHQFEAESISSGVPALDTLLGGGIERGTVTVVSGPSGVGKTTTGSHFMTEAVRRGEHSVIYMFEESTETFLHRADAIGLLVREMLDRGDINVEEVEPLAISSDEFAHRVRKEVEQRDASVVMIDGISGYRLSIRGDEDALVRELHSLCRYLRNVGVTVILVDDVGGITGEFEVTSTRISYLGDNILFLRYLEVEGNLRKAVGVLKKRTSNFERCLREFEISEQGIAVGEPLSRLRGILTGTPEFVDESAA